MRIADQDKTIHKPDCQHVTTVVAEFRTNSDLQWWVKRRTARGEHTRFCACTHKARCRCGEH